MPSCCLGIAAIVPGELFSLFTPHELERLLCGEPDVSGAVLCRRN